MVVTLYEIFFRTPSPKKMTPKRLCTIIVHWNNHCTKENTNEIRLILFHPEKQNGDQYLNP